MCMPRSCAAPAAGPKILEVSAAEGSRMEPPMEPRSDCCERGGGAGTVMNSPNDLMFRSYTEPGLLRLGPALAGASSS